MFNVLPLPARAKTLILAEISAGPTLKSKARGSRCSFIAAQGSSIHSKSGRSRNAEWSNTLVFTG
eukprot:11227431-Lingulodinium_polyedra.AAC.1